MSSVTHSQMICVIAVFFLSSALAGPVPLYLESVPLQDEIHDYFVMTVKVGNPPRDFNVTLLFNDIENANPPRLILIGPNATTPDCVYSQRRYFNFGPSTTFRQAKDDTYTVEPMMLNFEDCFVSANVDQFAASTTYGHDDVKLYDTSRRPPQLSGAYKNVPLGVITQFNVSFSPNWASDGVLGLDRLASTDTWSAAQAIALASGQAHCPLKHRQAAGLCQTVNVLLTGDYVQGQQAGTITFGEVADVCGDVRESRRPDTPASEAGVWAFVVTGMSINSTSVTGSGLADFGYIDLRSRILLTMPQAAMDRLAPLLGAVRNGTEYTVKCSDIWRLSHVNIRLDGATLTFSPFVYAKLVGL
ncbi:hypothetical protein AAVH_29005 [Aphelenchoides avenae]|nr:hypothetical protein AAVH_29005 [Aphelenchus avenae]